MSQGTPHGFHAHASGLLVPEEHARTRRVVTYDEWKKIDRALDAMSRIGLHLVFRCDKADCSPIQKINTPENGGTILRCDCTDRVFTKAF